MSLGKSATCKSCWAAFSRKQGGWWAWENMQMEARVRTPLQTDPSQYPQKLLKTVRNFLRIKPEGILERLEHLQKKCMQMQMSLRKSLRVPGLHEGALDQTKIVQRRPMGCPEQFRRRITNGKRLSAFSKLSGSLKSVGQQDYFLCD